MPNPDTDSKPETQELLPCPFCGGDGQITQVVNDTGFGVSYYKPECSNLSCGCQIYPRLEPRDAAYDWNLRTSLQGGQSE